jgi:hypothetical protein
MFLEPLESRLLMSVSPVDLQVTLDQAQVTADLVKFRADAAGCDVTLLADCQALKLAGLGNNATMLSLFTTLHTDLTQMQAQLAADRLAQSVAVLQAQANVNTDIERMIVNRDNPTALTADRALLLRDRVAVQQDDIAGLNTRIATRQTDYNTISADLQAISTAAWGDAGVSHRLTLAVQKFDADRTAKLATMMTDLTKVQTDRTTLSNDLVKLES